MKCITLIGTYHENSGNCNHLELLKIIEKIKPDVIFEEMPPSSFDCYYKNKSKSNLETDAINLYLEKNHVKHIPVDYDYIPPNSFFYGHRKMHEQVERFSRTYRFIIDRDKEYREYYGFKYLNSIEHMNSIKHLYFEIDETLKMFNKEGWFKINNEWNEVIEKRENEMMKNIYDYSKEYQFNNGLFLIGAAHRSSIIEKIQEYDKNYDVKINWKYGYDGNTNLV